MANDEIQRTLGNLESKLDSLLSMVSDHKDETRKEVADLKDRVSNLEIWRAKAMAYVMGGSAVLGFVYSLASKLLSYFGK